MSNRWDKIREAASKSQDEASRPSPKKKKAPPKAQEAERDEFGQPVYKGTMALPEMSPTQKRALAALVQQGTQETGEIVVPSLFKGQVVPPKTKVLPMSEVKTDHLLIKGIQIVKSMSTGTWVFGEIETNHGTFAMGDEHDKQLDQKMLQTLAMYLKNIFEQDLKEFLGIEDTKEKE